MFFFKFLNKMSFIEKIIRSEEEQSEANFNANRESIIKKYTHKNETEEKVETETLSNERTSQNVIDPVIHNNNCRSVLF